MYNFGQALKSDDLVWGAERPGYPGKLVKASEIESWIQFMKNHGIMRVCCLLDDEQLAYYPDNLLDTYREAWGKENVCHAPVKDLTLAPLELLAGSILPFLAQAEAEGQKVVVHCSGGMGRTGHVLAAWLVVRRGMSMDAAFKAVAGVPGVIRDPYEAMRSGTSRRTYDELFEALGRLER